MQPQQAALNDLSCYAALQSQAQALQLPLPTLKHLPKGHLIVSQNVQGLPLSCKKYRTWMTFWKQQLQGHSIYAVLLQETHTSTPEKINKLTAEWHAIWGKTNTAGPYAFWSTGSNNSKGVGILLPIYVPASYLSIPTSGRTELLEYVHRTTN